MRPRSIRTSGVTALAVVVVGLVAVVTQSDTMVGLVAGFAGTALGLLSQRHTSEDLARSRPVEPTDASH